MSPAAFSFKLIVPNDPGAADLVAGVATHAAEYAGLAGAAASGFVEQARALAARTLTGGGASCLAVFAAAEGRLSMTVGGESVSQPL
jgi:hypothetical protein